MTKGSTNAPPKLVSSESSRRAKTKETTAEASKMRTNWSLNCSRINCHRGVDSSSGSSVNIEALQNSAPIKQMQGLAILSVKFSMPGSLV